MPIHEKDLIRPENIKSHEHLVVDGVDVSGHWSTFIETRVVKDYNEALEEEIRRCRAERTFTAAGNAAPARIPARSTRSIRISIRGSGSI